MKQLECNSGKLLWMMDLLDVSEDDLVAVSLSALSPYQPGSMRQKMEKRQKELGRNTDDIPSPDELWTLFEQADFRCTLETCRSQLSVSIDRINTAKGYEPDNIRVLCRACNRRISRIGQTKESLNTVVFRAIHDCLQSTPENFPSNVEIKRRAGVASLSGSTYLVRYLRHRWQQKHAHA